MEKRQYAIIAAFLFTIGLILAVHYPDYLVVRIAGVQLCFVGGMSLMFHYHLNPKKKAQ